MRLTLAAAALLALTACGSKDKETSAVAVSVADTDKALASVGGERGFKIDTDGFKASFEVPGMEMGGKDFDIDGMTLPPGSKVNGMKVVANERDGKGSGKVTVTFTSPAAPAAVLDHAADTARQQGYAVQRAETTLNGTARKDGEDKSFVYTVAAAGSGTTGTVVMSKAK